MEVGKGLIEVARQGVGGAKAPEAWGAQLRGAAAALALVAGVLAGVLLSLLLPRPPVMAATPAALQAPASQLPAWARGLIQGPPLRFSSSGPRVLALQRLLHAQGYSLQLDGRFGDSTRDAVKSFQQRAGLGPNGVAGPETLKALVQWSWWYPVRAGDTLIGVARLYGTGVDTLMRLNGLRSTRLMAGSRLLVPRAGAGGSPVQWGRYVIRPGDSLWAIARRFSLSVEDLQRVNALAQPEALAPGQLLWLPMPSQKPARQATPMLSWPVRGPVTSGYGWRDSPFGGGREFHEGIDIAVPVGTPVRSAADGVVVQAGWMGAYGYGVVIRHAGGIETLYGHNRRLTVRAGQRVSRGQVIAYSGSTGRSTGPHLDFRVRVNGKMVDPVTLLAR